MYLNLMIIMIIIMDLVFYMDELIHLLVVVDVISSSKLFKSSSHLTPGHVIDIVDIPCINNIFHTCAQLLISRLIDFLIY